MTVENENPTGMSVTPWIFCFFIFALVSHVILDIYKKRHILKFSSSTNIFRFYPIIGHAHHLIGGNLFSLVEKYTKKYKLPLTFWIGHECLYITDDAAEMKVILNHPQTFNKDTNYAILDRFFRNSILLAKFDEWKIDRKLFQKAFTQNNLNIYVKTFYQHSCILVEEIGKRRLKNMADMLNRFSLGSACANITGLSDLDGGTVLTDLFDKMLATINNRLFSAFLFPDCLWKHTRQGREHLKDVNDIHQFAKDIIEKKKQHSSVEKEFHEESNCLLDLILENEDSRYSTEDTYNQFSLFILAATDTTALALGYTLTMLGMHPNIQEQVYEEVKNTVGLERPIYYNDLPKLKYTERAILEALRILPVIPFIGRLCAADLDLGTKIIPAGTNLILNFFHLHRSEKYWENPLEYDPDRFLPEEVAKRPPYTFLPFAGGPRICMGMKYAIMTAKTALAHVIRNYKVTSHYKSVEDIKLISGLTMKPADDLDCTFEPRK